MLESHKLEFVFCLVELFSTSSQQLRVKRTFLWHEQTRSAYCDFGWRRLTFAWTSASFRGFPKERSDNTISVRGLNTLPLDWEADTLPLIYHHSKLFRSLCFPISFSLAREHRRQSTKHWNQHKFQQANECCWIFTLTSKRMSLARIYGAPFVKILYLTDLAQKLLSLRAFSYLCAR